MLIDDIVLDFLVVFVGIAAFIVVVLDSVLGGCIAVVGVDYFVSV